MEAVDIGEEEAINALIGLDDSACFEFRFLRAIILSEMLQDLVLLAMIIEIADVDNPGGGAHVGRTEAAEIFEALPAIDHMVSLPVLGRGPFLLIVFGELDVVAHTDMR